MGSAKKIPYPDSFHPCRTEWQRKVIEAEREKRDFLERIEQEAQSGRQSAKKLEKVKRDLDKMGADSAQGWSRWWEYMNYYEYFYRVEQKKGS